jgi:hypothetical protein
MTRQQEKGRDDACHDRLAAVHAHGHIRSRSEPRTSAMADIAPARGS